MRKQQSSAWQITNDKMAIPLRLFVLLQAFCWTSGLGEFDHKVSLPTNLPLVLAHRGSSGIIPEHTELAYRTAIEQGADVIECDVTITKDSHLVCLHEPFLLSQTNVKDLPEFSDRLVTREYEGKNHTDYFTFDFTLQELKTLRKVQKFAFRDQSYNGQLPIATLEEYITIAKEADRPIGIYPELKHPKATNAIYGPNTMEDKLLEVLRKHGYTKATDPCFIQCFEHETLYYLKNRTQLPLVALIEEDPKDGDLTEWGRHFYAVGAWKQQVMRTWTSENGYKNKVWETTDFVEDAHAAGLKVHLYTFRNEDEYLAPDFEQDPYLEYEGFMKYDVDGYFTDFPKTFYNFLQSEVAKESAMACTNATSTMTATIALVLFTLIVLYIC